MPAQKSKGFSLVELLIAISIIAIISAIGITAYTQSQKLARDLKRKQDLRSVAVALELYYQKNKAYPDSAAAGCASYCFSDRSDPWIPGLTTNYVSKLPIDPTSNGGSPWVTGSYGYAYYGGLCSSQMSYILVAQLENGSDPDSHSKKNYTWCGQALPSWSGNSFMMTATP